MPAENASNRRGTVVLRARAGDRAAFDALYGEAIASVWQAAVRGWPRRADAEAITAAVLTEAFDALPELPDHVDFSAFCLELLARVPAQTTADASVPADS